MKNICVAGMQVWVHSYFESTCFSADPDTPAVSSLCFAVFLLLARLFAHVHKLFLRHLHQGWPPGLDVGTMGSWVCYFTFPARGVFTPWGDDPVPL